MNGRYERVMFTQMPSEADEFFRILDNSGMDAMLDYATGWHYPGEHETDDDPGHGRGDEVYARHGYTISWNRGLGYVGLVYDTEYEDIEAFMSLSVLQCGMLYQRYLGQMLELGCSLTGAFTYQEFLERCMEEPHFYRDVVEGLTA